MNAFVERWIQSLKYEALNHFIVFGQEHFDHIVSEYAAYYHDRRPHQGIGSVLLLRQHDETVAATGNADASATPMSLAEIKRKSHLGGLLKHFYRDAA
jgi:hypothetical protein